MKHTLIDSFCNELIPLLAVLDYTDEIHVKDMAPIGMTLELRNTWAMKTLPPANYMDYLDLLRQTGHQLKDVESFNQMATDDNHSSYNNKSDQRCSTSKNQRRKERILGNGNPNLLPPQISHLDRRLLSMQNETGIFLRL